MLDIEQICKKIFHNMELTPEENALYLEYRQQKQKEKLQETFKTAGGLNQIHLGDCLEILPLIPSNSIDLVYIDPPYEMKVSHGSGAFGVEKKLHYEQFDHIANGFDYTSTFAELERVMKAINLYIWCSKSQIPKLLNYFVGEKKCNWQPLRWIKTNPVPACGNSYVGDSEYCLFFREPGVQVYGTADSKKTYFISQTNKKDKALWKHPTIKPLDCVKNHIFNSTKEGDIVLDCFAGSGTTCVAAHLLKRNFIGIEIDEKYYKLANMRLEAEQSQQKLFY